jgi:hypothetical protein
MFEFENQLNWSADFKLATRQIRGAEIRPELKIQQIAAPKDVAENALAFSAETVHGGEHDHADHGTGRLVILRNAEPVESWGGRTRMICFAKSPLESNIGSGESMAEVAWSWLADSLHQRFASYSNEAGTATRILSTGFGSLAHETDHAQLEIRASWTPEGEELGRHFEAWQDLLCLMAGLPHLPAGVIGLGRP